MRRARRSKRKGFINYLIIGATFTIMFLIGFEEYQDSKIKRQGINNNFSYTTKDISMEYKEEQKKEEVKVYPKVDILKEYKGYDVTAKLEIPKIDLDTYILSTYSKKALNISPTKFWGANPNEKGNFCVAGHNSQNKNMFYNLRDLEIGDFFWVSDNNIGKVEYEIYDIYSVEPEDVKCLSQETEGRREVTLITCSSDSKKRIIVKAREKE